MDLLSSDRLQIAIIFGLGFIVSRLFVTTGLAERLVLGLIRRVHRSLSSVSLFLIFSAALLSSFIPNLISVLTLLPALKMLIERLAPPPELKAERRRTVTYLTCSLIWGANIGGNSSLTGSPANLLLLLFLEIFQVPGREKVGFLVWYLWGIPLVAAFGFLAWLTGRFAFRGALAVENSEPPPIAPGGSRIRAAAWLSIGIFLFSGGASAAGFILKPAGEAVLASVNLFTLLVAVAVLMVVFSKRSGRVLGLKASLLKPSDCWSRLPLRGLALAGAVVLVLAALAHWAQSIGFNQRLAPWIRSQLPEDASPLLVLFILAVATIYLTEFLSNSLVATALFYSADSLATALGLHPLPLFIGISMASTCAFMTPLATPVNSLAFGEIRSLSFARMAAAGFLLNLVGAVLVTLVAGLLVPAVLGIELTN